MATYSSKKYPSSSVTTAQLADGTVAAVDLANSSVSSDKLAAGAAVTNIGYTPFNKAGDSLGGILDLNGNKIRDTSGTGKIYTNVTPLYDLYASGSTTGALVIDTAIAHNAGNMCSITISGYSYNTGQAWEIRLGGYFGENNFYAMRASSHGHPFPYIRAAKKDSTNTMSFILGDTGGVYGTTIVVTEFQQTFSSQSTSYANGWTISRVTSTTGYSSLTTVTNQTPVMEVIDVLNINPAGNGFDSISNFSDGGNTYWQVVGSRVVDLYSTSGGHGGNWGYPVRIDTTGWYRLKVLARLSSTNGGIHGNTPSGNYKYSISFGFTINGITVGGKWDVDAAGNGTRVGAVSGPVQLSAGTNYQMTYATNGYEGIKQIYIYGLYLERVA